MAVWSANGVALALGSGGARGYAHIGVIDELRHRGYDIVGIAGSVVYMRLAGSTNSRIGPNR